MVIRGQLDPLVAWMREQGVRRVRLPDGLELELGVGVPPPADPPRPATDVVQDEAPVERPVPIAKALEDADGAGVCSCGHSWLEHSELGCFRGCSHTVCTASAEERAQ